jgi:hypothetical protein
MKQKQTESDNKTRHLLTQCAALLHFPMHANLPRTDGRDLLWNCFAYEHVRQCSRLRANSPLRARCAHFLGHLPCPFTCETQNWPKTHRRWRTKTYQNHAPFMSKRHKHLRSYGSMKIGCAHCIPVRRDQNISLPQTGKEVVRCFEVLQEMSYHAFDIESLNRF